MAAWDTKDYGWGSSIKTPDFSEAFKPKNDGAFSNAWKTGFDVEGGGKGISSLYSSLFDKARDTEKYRRMGESSGFSGGSQQGAFGGGMASGGTGKVLENLGVVFPQQHAPMFIPGVEGKKGLGSTIGGLAGIGASFIPGLGPGIAAAMPAIGSGIGGLFG